MKSNISISTTALEEFWEKDKNLVALGEWCKIDTDIEFVDTIPYIWNNASKKVEAIKYTLDLYNTLIEDISKLLNNYHKVEEPTRYWEIILGNWLITFIQAIYNRYLTIKMLESIHKDFSTILLDNKSFITPIEYTDFTLKVTQSDSYNLQLYTQIMKFLGYSFQSKKYDTIQEYSYTSKKQRITKSLFYNFIKFLSIKPSITIVSPYFDGGLRSYLNLFLKSKARIVYDDFEDNFDFRFKINKNDRKNIFTNFEKKDEFTVLLYSLFEVNFPILFIEGYKPFSSFVNNLKKNNSKLFTTANALNSNYAYKFYIAKNFNKMKVIQIQHGGNYGNDIISVAEYYEKKISDYFFTFGWKSKQNEKNCSHEKINLKIKPKKNGNILFISTGEPRYDFRINIVYTSSLVVTDYIPKIQNFLKNITNLDMFFYRPYSKDYGFKIADNIKNNFPLLKIEKERLSLKQRLQQSKLLISDHFGTSVLETLAQNYPTIIFIKKEHFLFRKPEIIALLEEAKILFYDEVAAAEHINTISDNIDKWWQSDMVQKAREKFCYYYARTSKDWAGDWIKEFNNILEENARNNS